MSTYRGASGALTTTTGLTLSLPAGTVAGDLLVAFVCHQPKSTVTPPAGWIEHVTATDDTQVMHCYTRTAQAGDASWTWTRAAAGKWTGHVVAYGSAAIRGTVTAGAPGSGNSWPLADLAWTGAGSAWRLDAVGQRSSTPATAWTAPAGVTVLDGRYSTGSGATYSAVGHRSVTAPPASGGTWANDGVASSAAAFVSLAIGDAAPPVPPTSPVTVVMGGIEVPVTVTTIVGGTEVPVSLTIA